ERIEKNYADVNPRCPGTAILWQSRRLTGEGDYHGLRPRGRATDWERQPKMPSRVKVGLVGLGYWGPNLLRNLFGNPNFQVVAVADSLLARRDAVKLHHPTIRLHEAAEELIDDPSVEAVVIATPVATHFPLTMRALQRGKHVLVEKPLCRSVTEG